MVNPIPTPSGSRANRSLPVEIRESAWELPICRGRKSSNGACERLRGLTERRPWNNITIVMKSKGRLRRKIHTKDRIVDAAFRIVRRRGLGSLSAREVARAMKASTMPIYSSLASMRDVKREVRDRAARLLRAYQAKPYTDDIYMNMALGYIDFARREKALFRLLFLDMPKPISAVMSEEAEAARSRTDFSRRGPASKGMEDLAFKMWAFTHGLAALVHSGAASELDDSRILALLAEAGKAFRKNS